MSPVNPSQSPGLGADAMGGANADASAGAAAAGGTAAAGGAAGSMLDHAKIDLTLLIDELPLVGPVADKLRRVSIDSHVNLPTVCEFEFADQDQDAMELARIAPGAMAQVRAVSSVDPVGTPLFSGRVESLEVRYDASGARTLFRAFDAGHSMLHATNTQGYPLMPYSAVAEMVGLRHEILTVAEPHPVIHDLVVQANETDWDFLVRLGREIGYVVQVMLDPVAGVETLVFGPPTPAESAPPPVGVEVSPLTFKHGDERILSLRASVTGSGLASIGAARGWDPLLGGPAVGESPVVDDTSANLVVPELLAEELSPASQRISLTRMAANEVEAEAVAVGTSARMAGAYANIEMEVRGNPFLAPNRAVSLGGFGPITGEYTITGTNHVSDQELGGYRTTISCTGHEDRTLRGLTDARGAQPGLFGVYPAIVADVADPELRGRVKLSLPWLASTFVSGWARVVQPGAGELMGAQIMPEPLDEVLVAFENGQLSSPYVLGGLYSETHQPAIGWAEVVEGVVFKRAFTSREGHQLIFDDSPETPGIKLATTFGASCEVSISPELGISIKTVEGQPITINSAAEVSISSVGNVSVSAAAVEISAEAAVSVNSEVSVELSAPAVSVAAEGDVSISGAAISLEAATVNVAGGVVNLGA